MTAPDRLPVGLEDETPAVPPVPPLGPIAQSVAVGFRALYVAAVLLAFFWVTSGVREIASDSQVVVRRFGRIVRAQQTGLLVAWPRPFEQVQILPGPVRQLSHDVSALIAPTAKYRALIGATSPGGTNSRTAPTQHAEEYLTGDRNVVLLTATLVYRISDPIAYALEETHVSPALDRLFRAAAVRVTAGRNLSDFIADQSHGQARTAMSAVRESLLMAMNDHLHVLDAAGAGLGVEIEQINLTPSLAPEAKAAYDQVLLANQAADRGIAVAKTDAERRRQQANREADQLVSAAQATAKEIVTKASVDTANILALERDERTLPSRDSLLLREYRARVANIMSTGRVTLVDPKSGVRVILPGKQP